MKTPHGRGRPPKFGRRARPITLTLPNDVIQRLGAIDTDLGRAIVSLVERSRKTAKRTRPSAEVASHGSRSVILVTPVSALRRLPGVQLVPVGDGRALIALKHPHGIPELELHLLDALDNSDIGAREREVLERIAEILRSARLTHGLTVSERSIIVFENRRRRAVGDA
jgi:hypothetical protein